jgi:hypothetical protein
MNRHFTLIGSTLMVVAGLGLTHAIAAEPVPQTVTQRVDVCRQVGAEYQELYTIEEATRSITICQKGDQYYHIITLKQPQNSASALNQNVHSASLTPGKIK